MISVFAKRYFKEISENLENFDIHEFEGFIGELKRSHEKGSQIFICGNGGSASTASHFACDMNKGVDVKRGNPFNVVCLSDNIPTVLAYANDCSYDDIFVEQLKRLLNKNDLVIGVSASGNSENVLKAIRYANRKGARTFGVCGYGGGRLKGIARRSIAVKSRDMQQVEDLHVILFHCAMQWFDKNPRKR